MRLNKIMSSYIDSGETVLIRRINSDSFTHQIEIIRVNEDIPYKGLLYNEITESCKEYPRGGGVRRPSPKVEHICKIEDINHEQLMKLISGGLKHCINDHGDITKQFIGSASKRVAKQINAYFKSESIKKQNTDKLN